MKQNAPVNAEAVEMCGDLRGLRWHKHVLKAATASHVSTQNMQGREPTGTYQ